MIIEPDTNRKFPRIHFGQEVNFELSSPECDKPRTQNLSLGGMFITGELKNHVDGTCTINLVPDETSSGLSLQALAKVVRKNDVGVAIEFTSMPLHTYTFLEMALRDVQSTLLDESEEHIVGDKILAEDCPFVVTEDLPIPSNRSWDVIVPPSSYNI